MDQKNIVTDKNKDHLAMLIERSTQDLHDRVNMQKGVRVIFSDEVERGSG
jgi:hypothetical protein